MSIKIAFEVSHAAQRKAKPAKGFTHDWELYVRSANKDGDLNHFVEKVVFNLHDTFVKPKRSIKEPPYVVKESGYAAFEVIIEIYLKNRDEPRKFTFTYDLDLQPYKSEIKEFTIENPSDDFRRKCLKGGCIQIGGSSSSSANVEYKKPKRPEDKTNKVFTDLFGPPLEKQQISKSDKSSSGQQQSSSKDQSSSTSSSKDKDKSSKHNKHTTGDSKESKKSSESSRSGGGEKVKKDKTKDRERTSEKKEKSSKRAPSPSPSRPTANVQNLQNSSLPISTKNDYAKTSHAPKPQTPIPEATKKSSKKKNYEKDREKNDRKESTKPPKEKVETSSIKKEKELHNKTEDRQKPQMMESKSTSADTSKNQNRDKDADRKHKHKKEKKEKNKEKEIKEKDRKEPKVKSQSLPVKPKPPPSEKESDSDSESASKLDEPMSEIIPQKTLTPPDKSHKKSSNSSRVEKTAKGSTQKDSSESKKRKRKLKEPSPSPSPPMPPKQSKRDYSPTIEKSNDSPLNAVNMKITNEYLDELKDLKNKINTLQSKELSQVVKLIASTGHYEITNSSFDFDLVKLDKSTVSLLRSMLLEKN